MDPFLAQIATSQWPIIFSVVAGLIGFTGLITAFMAHASISKDISAIKGAETTLASAEAWEGARTHSEHELSEWMRSRSIHPESGVADVIRACWSAWVGSRGTSLTELHVLVARRERSKGPARLSAGIAAVLLIIGIVGTLSSVKPILEAFQFRPSTPEGVMPTDDAPSLVNVEDSAALVNSLMHSLGEAFLPSLVALIATVIVVFTRGIYSHGLQRYTLQLDRFAMGTVMPHFRPRSISDEYEAVRKTFDALAKTIGEREAKLDAVVAQLTKFVDSVGPTLNGLDNGIGKMTAAADALATKSNSIASTLTRTLGKESPLYKAVNGFEGIFAATNQRLEQLSNHIEGIRAEQQEHRTAMLGTLKEVSSVISQVSGDHQRDREKALKAVTDLESVVATIPANLLDSARKSFDEGIVAMRAKLRESLDLQAKEASITHRDIRSETQEALDSISMTLSDTTTAINNSLKAVPEAVNRLNEALKGKSDIEKAAIQAIDSLAGKVKESIRCVSDNAIRNLAQPTVSAPPAEPAPSREPSQPPASDQPQPPIESIPQAVPPSEPEPPRSPEIDQPEPTLPPPRIVPDPSPRPFSPTKLDQPPASPPDFPDTIRTGPQPSPQATTETNHVKPKRGFLGGLFGGRKP
jgi:ABC-type transporter Mla subunit MlaD